MHAVGPHFGRVLISSIHDGRQKPLNSGIVILEASISGRSDRQKYNLLVPGDTKSVSFRVHGDTFTPMDKGHPRPLKSREEAEQFRLLIKCLPVQLRGKVVLVNKDRQAFQKALNNTASRQFDHKA